MVNGGNIDQKSLMGILKKVNNNSGTHELMVHPGINNTILGKRYNWGYHWKMSCMHYVLVIPDCI